MKAEVGRRAFLGSAVTLGIGSIGAVAAVGATGTKSVVRAGSEYDAVYNEIIGQFMRGAGRMQTNPGEAARQIGSSLRLLAEWGKAHGIDDAIRRGLEDGIRRHGREAMLAKPFDLKAEMVMRGWKLPPGFAPTAMVTDFGDSLDDLRRHGLTQHWFDYAEAFELAAPSLDRSSTHLTRVATQIGDCSGAQFMMMMLESQVFMACTFGLAIGPEVCAIATALALAWKWRMWWQGC
jgi:hypothetical protein